MPLTDPPALNCESWWLEPADTPSHRHCSVGSLGERKVKNDSWTAVDEVGCVVKMTTGLGMKV